MADSVAVGAWTAPEDPALVPVLSVLCTVVGGGDAFSQYADPT